MIRGKSILLWKFFLLKRKMIKLNREGQNGNWSRSVNEAV